MQSKISLVEMLNWDAEFDVVIVGSGFAGLAAAVEAKNADASVIIIEKRQTCGGNSIMSDGLLAVAGTPVQQKEGIEDSPELMYQDMLKAGRNYNNPQLARIVAEQSNLTLKWLINDIGVQLKDRVDQSGGHSVPRTHTPYNTSGTAIIKPFVTKAKELGIEIKTQTFLTRLLQDQDGAVKGVEINKHNHNEATQYIRAKKGVVLATGGFAGDVKLRTHQDPRLTQDIDDTNRSHSTAEALLEAMNVGADSVHLDWIQVAPWTSPDERGYGIAPLFSSYTVFPYGVLIDPATGKRFVNELADRKTRTDAMLKLSQPCIGIADTQGMANSGQNIDPYLKRKVVRKFSNLEDLSTAYGLSCQVLRETLNCYNNYIENLLDEEFNKPIREYSQPIQPPYYAVRLWPKVHYTMGGLKINSQAQVMGLDNQPIQGLYAAGEVTGGIHGISRLGACAVTECLVFGRIAGKNVAISNNHS